MLRRFAGKALNFGWARVKYNKTACREFVWSPKIHAGFWGLPVGWGRFTRHYPKCDFAHNYSSEAVRDRWCGKANEIVPDGYNTYTASTSILACGFYNQDLNGRGQWQHGLWSKRGFSPKSHLGYARFAVSGKGHTMTLELGGMKKLDESAAMFFTVRGWQSGQEMNKENECEAEYTMQAHLCKDCQCKHNGKRTLFHFPQTSTLTKGKPSKCGGWYPAVTSVFQMLASRLRASFCEVNPAIKICLHEDPPADLRDGLWRTGTKKDISQCNAISGSRHASWDKCRVAVTVAQA